MKVQVLGFIFLGSETHYWLNYIGIQFGLAKSQQPEKAKLRPSAGLLFTKESSKHLRTDSLDFQLPSDQVSVPKQPQNSQQKTAKILL